MTEIIKIIAIIVSYDIVKYLMKKAWNKAQENYEYSERNHKPKP